VKTTEPLFVIGIELRTDNNAAFETIPQHWQRFYGERILEQIPNRKNDVVYAIYTNYTNPGLNSHGIYSCVIGCVVDISTPVPAGMTRILLPASSYQVVSVDSPEAVGGVWEAIWQQDSSQRTFIADFECYFPDGRVEIYLGVHS
jgi:predicted transcriptional regulator YdeE